MEKRLIITRSDKNVEGYTQITHQIIERYAGFCGAEFRILDGEWDGHYHYRIMKVGELLHDYDKVMVIDSDTIIMPDCPSLFDIVPNGYIGTIYEDYGTRKDARRQLIRDIQADPRFENVGWVSGYINTGVCLFPKEAKEIFKYDKDKLWLDTGQDDVYLGWKINKLGLKVFQLPWVFNFMSMFAEPWCGLSKGDALILHYAGQGFTRGIERTTQIHQDFLTIYGDV